MKRTQAASIGAIALTSAALLTAVLLAVGASVDEAPAQPASTQSAQNGLRVYAIVLDGLRPLEVEPTLMPNLSELKSQGTWYEQARAVFPAETLPNHAAMMTGVLPRRNGIVANQFYRGNEPKEYLQYPEFLQADTLTTRLERAHGGEISTATVMSKEYLYGLFLGEHAGPGDPLPQREADYHWDPRSSPGYVGNPSYHAVDQSTINNGFLPWLRSSKPAPQFAFMNLGDIDRAGHADETGAATGGGVSAFRQGVIADTDTLIGLVVDELKTSGAWDESVLIFTSDHGMDWGTQEKTADIVGSLNRAGYSGGQAQLESADYSVVGGGGSELIYVHHRADIERMARIVSQANGVEFVATPEPVPGLGNPTLADMGIDHPRSPEIHAFLKPSWRSSPSPSDNPIPGNHGHPFTQQSTLLVAGGHPLLDNQPESVTGEKVYDPASKPFSPPAGGPGNLSVAPTVAALFGIGEPEGGYDGRPLTEAFDAGALTGRPPPSPSDHGPAPAEGNPDADAPTAKEPLLTVGVDVTKATLTDATYSLYVANRGNATAQGVVITNPVPQNTTLAATERAPLPPDSGAAACQPGAAPDTACRWAVGDLAPGASVKLEVTYALAQVDGDYFVNSTVSATAVNGGGTPSNADRSLGRASHVLEDAHVDDARPDTSFGACNQLQTRGDNAVTAFVDDDKVGRDWAAAGSVFALGWQRQRIENVWGAELQATAASVPASSLGASITAHTVTSSWAEGAGPCAGADGSGRDARAPSATEPNTEPVSEASATASAPVSGPGVVRWDVSAALDTQKERLGFGGFELRAASFPTATDTFAFHSSEAFATADRPRLVGVVTWAESPTSGPCVDADRETATGASHRAQRIHAYVTDTPERLSNAGGDGCNGYPLAGAPVGWEFDDDSPDVYISSLEDTAVRREVGRSGDAGPNQASTRTGAGGQTFIKIALDKPLPEGAGDIENRVAAIALIQEHDGKTAPAQGRPIEGVCEPDPTTTGCTTGEATNEDDVRRSWRRAVDLAIDKSDQPDPVKARKVLTYTLVVRSLGQTGASGVTVVDDLPATVMQPTATTSQGSCSADQRQVICDLGDLAPGAQATITIRVRPRTKGTIVNSASVSAAQPDADLANNEDAETTRVR